MNNIIILPNAKTYLYHNPVKLDKEKLNEVAYSVIESVSQLQEEERKLLKERIKILDELKELLPEDKQKLLTKYDSLAGENAFLEVCKAISYIVQNEDKVKDMILDNNCNG